MVASPIGEYKHRDWERMKKEKPCEDVQALRRFWECPLPVEEISNFTKVTLIISNDDAATPLCRFDNIPEDWRKEIWCGLGHFCAKAIPSLLQTVLE